MDLHANVHPVLAVLIAPFLLVEETSFKDLSVP
jgi:hypothetical protein